MNPVDPGEDKGILRVYGAGQPEYLPLPARYLDNGEGPVMTKWELSLEERQAILDGACIGLRMLTFGHALQPVYLYVEGTDRDPYRADLEEPQPLPPGRPPGSGPSRIVG